MQNFTIIKVGYSSGIYGCSGEYFQVVANNKNNELIGFAFVGMYGSDWRIAEALKNKGYIQQYIRSGTYGKIVGKDKNYFLSEDEAIETIKKEF